MKDAETCPWHEPMLMNGLTLWKAIEEKPSLFHRRHSLKMRWHWKKRELRRRYRSWLREIGRRSMEPGTGVRL